MDLKALDQRRFLKSIERYVEQLTSRPIELSIILNAKSTIEQQLKYFEELREAANADESCELDAEIARLRAGVVRSRRSWRRVPMK